MTSAPMTHDQINATQYTSSRHNHRWAVILAGGDGVRLRSLTRTVSGDDRPKQFSPLLAGHTLLSQTRLRIAKTIDPGRTLFVLTKAHEPFYTDELAMVPSSQMVVQPCNRGTLPAILWSLLRIIRLDDNALVGLFPSDHYYAEEDKFIAGVLSAFDCAGVDSGSVILLGAVARSPETEYGWIETDSSVARCFSSLLMRVKHFWEKPSYQTAKCLLDQGCLWNTFVMVGSARAFVELVQQACPDLYRLFEPLLALPRSEVEQELMKGIYDKIASGDFSKQVLARSTERLAVASLGDIGWSDLGDPRRLITTLHERGIENPWVESGACKRCGSAMGRTDSLFEPSIGNGGIQ